MQVGHLEAGGAEQRCGDTGQRCPGGVHDRDSCMVLGGEGWGGSCVATGLVGASVVAPGLVLRDWVRWQLLEPVCVRA